MTANPIETDLHLAIMVGNGAFKAAADYAMRTANVRSRKPGKARRLRLRMLVAILRTAARRPDARPDAIEIYRAYRPKLSFEDRMALRAQLGEDFDVLPVEDSDVIDQVLLDGENPLSDADILSARRLPPPPPGSPRRFGHELASELDGAFDRLVVATAFDRAYDEWLEGKETDPFAAAYAEVDEDADTDPVIMLHRPFR